MGRSLLVDDRRRRKGTVEKTKMYSSRLGMERPTIAIFVKLWHRYDRMEDITGIIEFFS